MDALAQTEQASVEASKGPQSMYVTRLSEMSCSSSLVSLGRRIWQG